MHHRKKLIVILCALTVIAAIVLAVVIRANASKENDRIESEAQKVSGRIEAQEYRAIVYDREAGKILVQRTDGNEITISVSPLFCKRVMRVYRQNDMLFFVLSAALDDEYGLIYGNGSSVNMDGLWSIKRAARNLYYYKTYMD